MEEEIM